jgi:TonB family protein
MKLARTACATWRDSIPPGGALVYLDSEVDRAVALERQKPLAKRPRVDGNVLVRFVVAPDGRVEWESYAVLHSTDRALERYAEETVGGSVYTPAMLDGEVVRQCIVVPIGFTAGR